MTLHLLANIAEDGTASQRKLADRIGAALGLTNALMKRCASKGWVKVRQIPPRRYAYYLTPQGFLEKSRRTAEYVSSSLTFFRQARADYRTLIEQARSTGAGRFVLYGTGDLADIATLAARDEDVELTGIVDPGCNVPIINGLPAYASLPETDYVILTDDRTPQDSFNDLCRVLPVDRILAPAFLHVGPVPGGESDDTIP